MKEGFMILCALLCMHVASGFPDPTNYNFQEAAAIQKDDYPQPPQAQVIEQGALTSVETEDKPEPPPGNGMAFMQMLNAIMNGDFDAKAQARSPTIPSGLKSTGWSVKLQMSIRNHRSETVYLWWVNYSGNAVCYQAIHSGQAIRQLTFGTHPWLITNTNGDLITYLVPCTSNLDFTVQQGASW